MILSLRRSDREQVWKTLEEKMDNDEIVLVKAIEANKGGLMVESGGIRGFLPVSQLSAENYPRVESGDKNKILEKLRSFVNKNFSVKILSLEPESNKLIVSEKKATEGKQSKEISKIEIGEKVKAEITGIADFGIFVRFSPKDTNEEVDGLVHISEISWDKVSNLKKQYKIGDQIEAEVISTDNNRVSLSVKRLKADPWLEEVANYKEGENIKGTITRITPFGAFVALSKKVEGLLHISEITDKKITDPNEVIEQGKEYDLKIISIDPSAHRVALSLKRQDEKKKELEDLELSKEIIKKLNKAGYKKIEKILVLNEEELEKIGLDKKQIKELVKKIQG
jgi:small subunit ribosomal protein S1